MKNEIGLDLISEKRYIIIIISQTSLLFLNGGKKKPLLASLVNRLASYPSMAVRVHVRIGP